MLKKTYKWLSPGMKIKRWIFLSWIGLTIFILGVILIINPKIPTQIELGTAEIINKITGYDIHTIWVDIIFITVGFVLIIIGILKWFKSIYEVAVPYRKKDLVDVVYDERKLAQGVKIVTIGGGTGLSSLLRGLKSQTSNIAAVVTVADDGGSSGRLRKEMGVLPPGDIRNCLVALADEENLMSELFQYRFHDSESLEGHSFGNLLLAAMTDISGSFDTAVKQSSKILAIKGRVLPATLYQSTLCAVMEDDEVVRGESSITHDERKIKKVFLEPEYCKPLDEVIEAISESDFIVLGPGSLYTSVIPNLLVDGVISAITNSKAVTLYVCNVMTQPGETDGFSASDHLKTLKKHAQEIRIDYCLVNDEIPSPTLQEKYKLENAYPVPADVEEIEKMGVKPIKASLISQTNLVRHDPAKLSDGITKLIMDANVK